MPGTSLKVQWLRLHASNAEGAGSIPDSGAKIPHDAQARRKRIRSVSGVMNNNSLCFLPSSTHSQSEGLPLGLPPWFTGNQHHLPSCKHSQVLKPFLPDIQTASSDISFFSEPGREALPYYFLAWIVHHFREQHLTPQTCSLHTFLL